LEDRGVDAKLPERLIVRDTLDRLLERLTPAETRCYELLKNGYEQRDLARTLGISRQAASKFLRSIRNKFKELEQEDSL